MISSRRRRGYRPSPRLFSRIPPPPSCGTQAHHRGSAAALWFSLAPLGKF